MANTQILSRGNVAIRWALPGWAANWRKPTVAEVNATLDVTDTVAWSDFGFGTQASNQISDPSVGDQANTQTRGFAQFGGTMSFFYPRAYGDASDQASNTFEALRDPQTIGYILIRADGLPNPEGSRDAIAGDFWHVYRVMSDGWSDVVVGEVNFKYTITFQPQGDLWTNAWVGGTPTITATITGGNAFTAGQKKPIVAYLTGRQVHTLGYASKFQWVSSDSEVASVDANGVVVGVAAGSADITGTDVASGVSSTPIAVTVT